jgi:hypothetical protein
VRYKVCKRAKKREAAESSSSDINFYPKPKSLKGEQPPC